MRCFGGLQGICRRRTCRERRYLLVMELAAAGFSVMVRCRVLTLSCQLYYRWLAEPITRSEVVEAYRANALFDAHKDDPEFGRRVARRQGPRRRRSVVGWHGVVDRVEQQLVVRVREETGAAMVRSPGSPVQDDLCAVTDKDERNRHELTAEGPNQL